MNFIRKSQIESESVLNEISEIIYHDLKDFEDSCSIAVTGSLGKREITSDSDIDLFCVIDNDVSIADTIFIRKALNNLRCRFPIEKYPVGSLVDWKWIIDYSFLYASDIFFSVPVYGKRSLLDTLKVYFEQCNRNASNIQIYLLYNYLYRSRQIAYSKNEHSLKYRKGGLRDFQMLRWIALRLCGEQSHEPEVYLLALQNSGYIDATQYKRLVPYCNAIMAAKWRRNDGHEANSLLLTAWTDIEIVKDKALRHVFQLPEDVDKTLFDNSQYYLLGICEFIGTDLSNEIVPFIRAWHACDRSNIDDLLENAAHYFSVRAALSQNSAMHPNILERLFRMRYIDMSDIRNFVRSNANYKEFGGVP